MKKSSFTSVKELPIMLSVSQVAAVLNISRASAYELARCKNFPAMLVGCRIVVPKDKLLAWIEARVAMNEAVQLRRGAGWQSAGPGERAASESTAMAAGRAGTPSDGTRKPGS